MSEKTSQKTEEEMLDQTFGGYDEEMTAQTEDPQTAAPAAQGEKKKSNQNLIIFGAGGIAALGVLGWMFMKGTPAPQPTPPVAQTQTSTQPVTPPQPASAPVAQVAPVQADVNASAPVAGNNPTPNVNGTNTNTNSNDAAAANFLSNQPNNPMAGNKQVDTTQTNQPANSTVNPVASTTAPDASSTSSVNSVAPATTPAVSNVPNTVTNTPAVSPASVAPVAGNNAVQQALVDQLRQMFDQQTKEIKSSVDQVGNRVTDLEKAVADQKNVNKSIEDRLAKLEAGKPTKVASSGTTDSASTDTTPKETKPVVKTKKVYHRHTIVRRVVKEKTLENDQNVLVDKSSERSAPVYGDVRIHSVYAGRVWIKNKDGSLSTYASGERLPDGEVIRRIDDDKAQIITDKRVIR